jgi:hypothetical protein
VSAIVKADPNLAMARIETVLPACRACATETFFATLVSNPTTENVISPSLIALLTEIALPALKKSTRLALEPGLNVFLKLMAEPQVTD